ncbi:MAG: hypothetical protein OJF52_001137 [Nitrospira sp.]|jgi:hypothetical protein|nr:MAG: hypothetical protein OJF52_001137 [Nitrospira sp.]
MSLIWCSISGHGYGHAAQVVPVLNVLGRLVPNLTATLRTAVPAAFFEPRLTIPWRLSPAQQDIGCIQDGPLKIDVPGTWAAHRSLHVDWAQKIHAEAALILAAGPACVLSDISPLAIAAGASTGIPTIGLCSLSWDLVLEPFFDPAASEQASILQQIRDAYAKADCFLRVAPGLPVKAFRKVIDIGPIAEPAEPDNIGLRKAIGAEDSERIVLVGFGGIALRQLPFERMESMPPYRFLVDGPVPKGLTRTTSLTTLGWPFKPVLASVDMILTKPGYGTIVEAVALGTAVVYVRRYNFADEQTLVDYLHRHGRGAELSLADFQGGDWRKTFDHLQDIQFSTESTVPLTGAQEAATFLAPYLTEAGT